MARNCIECGKPLPEDARFCPHCTALQNLVKVYSSPKRKRRRPLLILAVLAVLILVGTAFLPGRKSHETITEPPHVPEEPQRVSVESSPQPRVTLPPETLPPESSSPVTEGEIYKGAGEVYYPCGDITYHVFLNFDHNSLGLQKAATSFQLTALDAETLAVPSLLAVYRSDSLVNANEEFMALVKNISVEAIPVGDGRQMDVTIPDYDPMFPYALAMSSVTAKSSCGTNKIQWNIVLHNGDQIVLSQTVYLVGDPEVYGQRTALFDSTNTVLDTVEDIKKLLERIEMEIPDTASVIIRLPAITYEGDLSISYRGVQLIGSVDGDHQTTFTGQIRVESNHAENTIISHIYFLGTGGTAITADCPVSVRNCTISGYHTGVYVGSRDISMLDCEFGNNVRNMDNPENYDVSVG